MQINLAEHIRGQETASFHLLLFIIIPPFIIIYSTYIIILFISTFYHAVESSEAITRIK